jgi:alpha-L-fucosidase
LLSIPVRADGTIDSDEVKVVEDIAAWMDVNRECIFGTRPWKVFGEGPAIESAPPITRQGFNEGKGKPFTAEDMRFTQKGDSLYAIVMGWPTQPLRIKSLGKQSKLLDKQIAGIQLLGSNEEIQWSQGDDELTIEPAKNKPSDAAVVFKIKLE